MWWVDSQCYVSGERFVGVFGGLGTGECADCAGEPDGVEGGV